MIPTDSDMVKHLDVLDRASPTDVYKFSLIFIPKRIKKFSSLSDYLSTVEIKPEDITPESLKFMSSIGNGFANSLLTMESPLANILYFTNLTETHKEHLAKP